MLPFRGKLLALPTDISLAWKGFTETNTLAYLTNSQVTKKKRFREYGS
jgi:hypothetical protein